MESRGVGNTEESRQIHKNEVSVLILGGLCSSGEASHSEAEIAKLQVCIFVCHHWCSGRGTLYLCRAHRLPVANASNNKTWTKTQEEFSLSTLMQNLTFGNVRKRTALPLNYWKLTTEREKEGRMMLSQLLITAVLHQHSVLELCLFRHVPTILVHTKTFTQPQPVNEFYFFSWSQWYNSTFLFSFSCNINSLDNLEFDASSRVYSYSGLVFTTLLSKDYSDGWQVTQS